MHERLPYHSSHAKHISTIQPTLQHSPHILPCFQKERVQEYNTTTKKCSRLVSLKMRHPHHRRSIHNLRRPSTSQDTAESFDNVLSNSGTATGRADKSSANFSKDQKSPGNGRVIPFEIGIQYYIITIFHHGKFIYLVDFGRIRMMMS